MLFFFFSFTATSVCSTLSLHDALPICWLWRCGRLRRLSWFLNALRFRRWARLGLGLRFRLGFGLLLRLIAVFTLRGVWSFARRSLWLRFGCLRDPKCTRLNSCHVAISNAVFCLKNNNRW